MVRGSNRDGRGNIRYKHNKPPRGLVPSRLIMDDIVGIWVPESRLVTNYFGERQDPTLQRPDSEDFRR